MRATTVFRKLLSVTHLFVTQVAFAPVGLVLDVRPSWRRPRCSHCGKVARGYDTRPRRLWRHLAQGRNLLWLAYAQRRVNCPTCGVRVEQVPWAEAESRL